MLSPVPSVLVQGPFRTPSAWPTAALLFVQFVLMWAAFFVLSAAIGWPASLALPAAEKLALVAAHQGAVLAGYGLYFGSAFAFALAAVLLRRTLLPGTALGDVSVALGVTAGVLKMVALSRWLLVAPVLAAAAGSASGTAREAVVAVFDGVDTYGGGVGEVLGVGLFSSAWTAAVAAGLIGVGTRGARALGLTGLCAAALLASSVPAGFGVELGPVLTVSGITWQLWLGALAVWLVRRTSAGAETATGTGGGSVEAWPGAARRARRTTRPAVAAVFGVLGLCAAASPATAQSPGRSTVAEVGIGLGKSDFYGRLEEAEEGRDARGFSPNLGGTVSLAVYQRVGPLPQLYLGGRFKVHIATPTSGDGPDEYFFNHYYGAVSGRVYPLSGRRTGPYVQADLTYGQFTEKLRDEGAARAEHQFAVGPGVLGAVGYALPAGGERRLNVQFYVQRNAGNGDVDGEGPVGFGYGALGAEVVFGF